MSCCPHTTVALSGRHRVNICYGGGRPLIVKGPVTGVDYPFSGIERLRPVDPRDAIALVQSPLFRIVGIVELPVSETASSKDGRIRDA